MKKTYIIWLTNKRKLYCEANCFLEVLKIISEKHKDYNIKRIYCVDDDCSLVMFHKVSEPRV